MQLPLTGGCHCQQVRYEITTQPLRMGLCYCRSCQYSTGSAYYPFLSINEESLKITGKFNEYITIGSSGKSVHRCFCANCGTLLLGRPESRPGLCTVSASSLDNPTIFSPEIAVWVSDAQPWTTINPVLKRFDKNPF